MRGILSLILVGMLAMSARGGKLSGAPAQLLSSLQQTLGTMDLPDLSSLNLPNLKSFSLPKMGGGFNGSRGFSSRPAPSRSVFAKYKQTIKIPPAHLSSHPRSSHSAKVSHARLKLL